MKAVGVIVEYNPLHNGHVYHLQEARRLSGADAVVAVMSGPFLQRGEPAIVGKRARTEMALHAGADLVLELPVAYAVQPAEWFAFGAVSLLDRTGIVDSLCFGSESGDLDSLQRIARVLAVEPAGMREDIARRLREGASYPA
uniref:nucleotidyltransferase family protein n=1 Tax=Paenibacillus sp. PAMC 26794 TaxID=1257080 RepID=UPI00037236AC